MSGINIILVSDIIGLTLLAFMGVVSLLSWVCGKIDDWKHKHTKGSDQ